jgi:hypothetical protein
LLSFEPRFVLHDATAARAALSGKCWTRVSCAAGRRTMNERVGAAANGARVYRRRTTPGRRWFRTANGLLLPFPVFQMYYHPLITLASLWAVTFPGSMWYPAVFFHREAASHVPGFSESR